MTERIPQSRALLVRGPEFQAKRRQHGDRQGHRQRKHDRYPQVPGTEEMRCDGKVCTAQHDHDQDCDAIPETMANDKYEETGQEREPQPRCRRKFTDRSVVRKVRKCRRRDLDTAQVRALAPRVDGRKMLYLLRPARLAVADETRGRRIERRSRRQVPSGLRRNRRSVSCPRDHKD